MRKTIVFDFDKTLTNYDTTLPFFLYCCKSNYLRLFFLPIYLIFKILSKLNIISIKQEKQIGLKLFCTRDYRSFQVLCKQFADNIKLNTIFEDHLTKLKTKHNLYIASASFEEYLIHLFPDITVIGTQLKINSKKGRICGIKNHPFREEKLSLLMLNNINHIDVFYTDSDNDIPTTTISKKVIWVKNGKVINR